MKKTQKKMAFLALFFVLVIAGAVLFIMSKKDDANTDKNYQNLILKEFKDLKNTIEDYAETKKNSLKDKASKLQKEAGEKLDQL